MLTQNFVKVVGKSNNIWRAINNSFYFIKNYKKIIINLSFFKRMTYKVYYI